MIIGPACGDGTCEVGGAKDIRRVTFLGIRLAAQIWPLCAGLASPVTRKLPRN